MYRIFSSALHCFIFSFLSTPGVTLSRWSDMQPQVSTLLARITLVTTPPDMRTKIVTLLTLMGMNVTTDDSDDCQ